MWSMGSQPPGPGDRRFIRICSLVSYLIYRIKAKIDSSVPCACGRACMLASEMCRCACEDVCASRHHSAERAALCAALSAAVFPCRGRRAISPPSTGCEANSEASGDTPLGECTETWKSIRRGPHHTGLWALVHRVAGVRVGVRVREHLEEGGQALLLTAHCLPGRCWASTCP